MRRPRHLSAEERSLWDQVARAATPMDPARPTPPTPVMPKPKAPPPLRAPLLAFEVGSQVNHRRDHDLMPALTQTLRYAPVQMDAKAHGKMTRGKLRPEARIDLHGMTVAEAHPALRGFILSEHAAGSRLVLVITGKGKLRDYEAPMPVRQGVLRHQVPQWLRLPPLNHIVMQITPANIRHGGEGALYVYLRRTR